MSKLLDTEFNPYYTGYISKFRDQPILSSLRTQKSSFTDFLSTFPSDKTDYRYEATKWTPLQIFGHLMDTERIMAYRALAISRKDVTPLPGFDQDAYVDDIDVNHRTVESYISEFDSVRNATISLFDNFSSDQLLLMGNASKSPVSVRALGYIILGHTTHHQQILQDRYLGHRDENI